MYSCLEKLNLQIQRLPPFAVMLALEQVVEYVLLYLAGRAYTTPRMAGFFGGMQMQFSPYVNRGGTFRASMTPSRVRAAVRSVYAVRPGCHTEGRDEEGEGQVSEERKA